MKEVATKGEAGPKEETKVMEGRYMHLERRVKSLKEGFFTFSKFILKVPCYGYNPSIVGTGKGGCRLGHGRP